MQQRRAKVFDHFLNIHAYKIATARFGGKAKEDCRTSEELALILLSVLCLDFSNAKTREESEDLFFLRESSR